MEKIQVKLRPFLSPKIAALLLILCLGCSHKNTENINSSSPLTAAESVAKDPDQISIMSMNVENLFDTEHDNDREDFTFLPRDKKKTPEVQKFCSAVSNSFYRQECFDLDWSDEVLKVKLQNIGQVIKYVDRGKGPDNLVLVEVENERVLKKLVDTELTGLGYQTVVVLEGPDRRGIDPGFISKFPLAEKPQLHIIPFHDLDAEEKKDGERTRGILEVTVKSPTGLEISFFAGHFPSQANSPKLRHQALQFGRQLLESALAKGRLGVLAGDLNITAEENEKEKLFETILSPVSLVSHLVGCKSCLGSHFYRGGWSFLDVISITNNIEKLNWEIVPDSIQVVRSPVHTKKNGTPLRFDADKREGVSDHFPLYERLQPVKKSNSSTK